MKLSSLQAGPSSSGQPPTDFSMVFNGSRPSAWGQSEIISISSLSIFVVLCKLDEVALFMTGPFPINFSTLQNKKYKQSVLLILAVQSSSRSLVVRWLVGPSVAWPLLKSNCYKSLRVPDSDSSDSSD